MTATTGAVRDLASALTGGGRAAGELRRDDTAAGRDVAGSAEDRADKFMSQTGRGETVGLQPRTAGYQSTGRPSAAERVKQMVWSGQDERRDAADHLHRKLLEVEKMRNHLEVALKELLAARGNPDIAKSPLPPKARLGLVIMNGIDETKREEYKGIFGWEGNAAKSISSDEMAMRDAIFDCQGLELRIAAYEEAILQDSIDRVHQRVDTTPDDITADEKRRSRAGENVTDEKRMDVDDARKPITELLKETLKPVVEPIKQKLAGKQ